MTEKLAAESGMTMIPPFDHHDVIAGQGTTGCEILADLPDVQAVLVPIGGGGLASGVAVAIKETNPAVQVIGVEPELAADAAESLRAGRLVRWTDEQRYRTSADGVRTNICERTFAHLKKYLDGVVTVSEEEITAAIGVLARKAHLVAEPSGALTTAAHLCHRAELPTGSVVAVVSGGNIEPAALLAALA
ncbi:threonine ammonia-lyase [Fodinicola feengrottensis]|nr:pyridoxal-phosphate dependent enzyme [Fodinicola feengrottensis]